MQSTPQHAARVLGLNLEASIDDVRRVRRKMALKYHPDCSDDQERATRHMARINAAADTLSTYLKDAAAFNTNAACTRRNATKQARRREAPKSKPAEKTSETNEPKAETVQRKPEQSAAVQRQLSSDKAWKAERALARYATESYSKVLNGIGRAETCPTVDVKVLSFAAAA